MRGGASAVVAIVLPHFLTYSLGPDRFAGWALMLQVAAYANYLDFGLQTAVARYLAGALEKGDHLQRDRLLSSAIAVLTVAGVIAVCGLAIAAWQLPHLFHSVPTSLAGEIGSGVIILGLSAGICLPLSAYSGVLVGMQRNEFPAIATASSRLLGAVAVVVVSPFTHSLFWLSMCVGGFNIIGALAQYVVAKRLLPDLRFSFASLDRRMTAELFRYCSTLSVWSLSMLMISGLDVTIVGLFRFPAVGAYSIAATLIMFFTGLIGAAYSAMLAPIAVLQARLDYSRISRLILVATRLNSYFSIGIIVVTFLFGEALIRTWVGPAYLPVTLPVLKILLVAQAIRLVGSAYGTALVGLGLQRHGLVPALVEGIFNLALSVAGIILIGPLGVAWATLVAAVIALSIIVFWILPHVTELSISRKEFFLQGILIPFLPALPLCLWMVYRVWIEETFSTSPLSQTLSLVVVLTVTTYLIWVGIRRTFEDLRTSSVE